MVRCWPFVFPINKRLLNEQLHWTVTHPALHWLQQSARLRGSNNANTAVRICKALNHSPPVSDGEICATK